MDFVTDKISEACSFEMGSGFAPWMETEAVRPFSTLTWIVKAEKEGLEEETFENSIE